MIDEIRNILGEVAVSDQWALSLGSPVRRDITERIRTLETAQDAQLQLFTTPNDNGSVRCGLEVVYGNLPFRERLASSLRRCFEQSVIPPSTLISKGATICRLNDDASLNPKIRLGHAREFYQFVDRQLNFWINKDFPEFASQEAEHASRSAMKEAFETYLYENNTDGSGKASSYIKALTLLEQMLRIEPYNFQDCSNIWSIQSVSRLRQLRMWVLQEQRKKSSSPWVRDDIPASYLSGGHCSAALSELIEFIPQFEHTQKVIELYKSHKGGEEELANKLNIEPNIPIGYVHDPKSKDGQDRIAEAKTRIGQQAFRKMILGNYDERCCITGLDIPTLNRASHIIGWAEKKETRMDPRNGLCLSATYDAAFDKKLISLDENYRIILSKEIREHYTSESVQTYFRSKEGDAITLPKAFLPMQDYLQTHRSKGSFR